MDGYVTELMDYIDTYRTLIRLNLYDNSRKQNVDEIYYMLDKLSLSYATKQGLDDFDFGSLKKKINFVFHPDVYTYQLPEDLGIDKVKLISKVNNALTDIITDKMKGERFHYDYDVDSDSIPLDNQRGNVYDDYGAKAFKDQFGYRYNPEYEREKRREERRENFSNFVASAKERVKDAAHSAFEYSKERIGAWLFDIPANEQDFVNIRNSMMAHIEDMYYRQGLAQANARINSRAKSNLIARENQELSIESLDARYNNEVIMSYNRLEYLRREIEITKAKLDERFETHRPHFDKLMAVWEKTSNELFTGYMDSRYELKNVQSGFQDGNRPEKAIKKDVKKQEKQLDRYPNKQEAVNIAVREATKDDVIFEQLRYIYDQKVAEYNQAYNNHGFLVANKPQIINNYAEDIKKKYNKKLFAVDLKIKHFNLRDRQLGRDIERTKDKLAQFIDKYEGAFTQGYKEETGRSR